MSALGTGVTALCTWLGRPLNHDWLQSDLCLASGSCSLCGISWPSWRGVLKPLIIPIIIFCPSRLAFYYSSRAYYYLSLGGYCREPKGEREQ